MKKYFIYQNEKPAGPYSIEELLQVGINTNTPIWAEGMNGWTNAGNIGELKDLLINMPPEFKQKVSQYTSNSNDSFDSKRKDNKMFGINVSRIIVSLFLIGVLIVVYVFYSNRNQTASSKIEESKEKMEIPVMQKENEVPKEQTEAEKLAEYIIAEEKNPNMFLKTKFEVWENLIGEWVIDVSIVNTAIHAHYKDIVVEVVFISNTGVVLGKTEEVVYEYLGPGFSVKRKFKHFAPSSSKSVKLNILSAKKGK